ncbi:BatD family protein [Nautilia sp.]
MKKILLLIPMLIFAYVNVHVNKKTVFPSEEVVFTIEATGNKIKFPDIKDIEGFPVQGTAVTQNITILNGNMQESMSKSYIFFPTKSVTIPSFTIKVDSKTYKTDPIAITVKKPKESKNSDFKLKLYVNRHKAYIGEAIVFKIKFFQKEDTSPQSIEIQKPNFNDFVTKQLSKKEYKNNGFDITEYSFLLIPQKSGKYKIGPILAKVGYLSTQTPFNDPFFNMVTSSLKYTNIFSNSVELNISDIPKNTVFGSFKAYFSADKTQAEAGEPVKITLNIKGCGDFYDLPDFKLNIPEATVYENTPQIKTFVQNSRLCGTYTKEYTIISNKDIVVPSVEFKTFNGKTETVKTNRLYIKIKKSMKKPLEAQKTKNKIKEKIIYKTKTSYALLIITFIIGVITGVLVTFLIKHKTDRQSEDTIKKIKKANQKELFNLLLEYSNHPEIEKILKLLEENIYNNQRHNINKKEIIKIIKKIKKQ